MAQAVAGDRQAIESLWLDSRCWVAVVLMAHRSAALDLDDLLQEVAATLVARIGDVRDPASFRPWLRMVAVNAARAASRSARIRQTHRLDADLAHSDRRGVGDDPHDEASRMLAMVDELPEPYREPLLLRSLQDLTTRQVAEILELPETTIETRLSRARRMLRERQARREALLLQRIARRSGAGSRPAAETEDPHR